MTYSIGGAIEATDYNTFATLTAGMNEIYADNHTGATTLPTAGFGYGQSPALAAVSVGAPVLATEWAALFETMRDCGTHQGTIVSPPVPVVDPVSGDPIVAENTPTLLSATIASLQTNKFVLAPGQTSMIPFPGTGISNPSSWTSSLVYTFQTDFGSWDNARYFFNSGSSISITAVYSPAPTPDELAWQALFANNFPVNMNWQTTTPAAGGNVIVNPPGFYLTAPYPGLTTVYQDIYQQYVGTLPYSSTNYARIRAKLSNIAGTNGKIDFEISLVDIDAFPVVKAAGRVTYTINRIQSAGTIVYPGGASFTSGGFV